MWQKQLKKLRKTLPTTLETKPILTPNTKNNTEQVVNFADYCANLNVVPLNQDTIVIHKRSPQPFKNTLNIATRQEDFANFDFIDAENSPREFFRHGQKNLPRELRSGRIRFQQTLDVHHMTRSHALSLLENMIENSPAGSVLKIIHGIGLNSNYNQPVLLGIIRKYLTNHHQVLGFSYGSPEQGGNGITIIKLTR